MQPSLPPLTYLMEREIYLSVFCHIIMTEYTTYIIKVLPTVFAPIDRSRFAWGAETFCPRDYRHSAVYTNDYFNDTAYGQAYLKRSSSSATAAAVATTFPSKQQQSPPQQTPEQEGQTFGPVFPHALTWPRSS